MSKTTLKVGAVEYVLDGGVNTMIALEKEFDASLFQMLNRFQHPDTMKIADLGRLIRHGLRVDGKKVDEDRAAEILEAAGIEECMAAGGRMINAMFAWINKAPATADI